MAIRLRRTRRTGGGERICLPPSRSGCALVALAIILRLHAWMIPVLGPGFRWRDAATGAGAMLLLVSDVRLAVPGAYKVGFTEPRLGMPLPELPALLARERLDRRRLHELTALGRIVGPKEAAEAGFFDAMATPETLRRTAIEHAREISELGDAAYRGSLEAAWMQSLARIRELVAAQSKRRDSAIAAAR